MIPFDFDYYRPATVQEAVSLYARLDREGKRPLYWSGGTEIATFARWNRIYTEAVIDLKAVPECRALTVGDREMTFGSALSLSEIHDSGAFPLLGETGGGIADRTSRNKITLGGNVCSRMIYKEAVLPLLLADSDVLVAGASGVRRVPIGRLFDRSMRIGRGEFLVQFVMDAGYRTMPYASVKKRKASAIEYPIVTVAALATGSGIRFAFSGLCDFPFRSAEMERILNRRELPAGERIRQAAARLPAPVIGDIKASAEYRKWVWTITTEDVLKALEPQA
ncbi:FAD binding domain-containing protein [Cohnella thermotolerans]|jgi:CO/xanthine dehydrogenase FAD-binding subunit|uniref:FAD binding domain-containing protein n=1 Tax=Cohnella thermotolerans TaxID=329858 RepID=UPI00040D33B1|nr:FAD binding domain-containing protein [Cohnella thermotolerans]